MRFILFLSVSLLTSNTFGKNVADSTLADLSEIKFDSTHQTPGWGSLPCRNKRCLLHHGSLWLHKPSPKYSNPFIDFEYNPDIKLYKVDSLKYPTLHNYLKGPFDFDQQIKIEYTGTKE